MTKSIYLTIYLAISLLTISLKGQVTNSQEITRNPPSNTQYINSALEKNELYIDYRKRAERKEYIFKFNCDSCLLALKMYKYSFDNGMSFSSDVFDPLKTYINSCYESNKITNQSNKCESLNLLFSKFSKITDQNWNFSNQNMFIFQFNTKNIFSNFSKAIREQVAPDCEQCSKELTSFKKLVSKGYGEIEFNSNIILQRCIAQRKNLCSNGYFKKVNSLQDKIKLPLKVVAKRNQKPYNIVQEIGHLQIFKENNNYGFLNNGVLILPPSFISIRIVKINSNSFVYTENIQKQTLYSQYGDIVFEKNKGNIIIDEENNFIAVKSDKKWQLFLPEQLRLSLEKYDKIESINGGNLIFAWNDNQFRLINKKGSSVSDTKYDAFINDKVISNKDFIILEKSNKQGIVNSKGIEVVPFIYDKIGFNVNEYNVSDFIKGRIKVENNGKIGFINESGKELVPIKYDEIEGFGSSIKKFSDKLVIVKNNGKVGLIDFEDGQLVIPVLYNEIFEFKALTASSYKIAKVNKNGKYGFVNMDGEEIIPPIYDEIKDFNNGYASFRINNKWGLINSLGKETINSSYDEPLSFNGNETYATLNGSKVKIDRFGNRINETPVYETQQPEYETKQPLVSANVQTTAFICGTSTVSDVDGNQYNTVLIGTQCWTKENLRVTKYRDGTVIPLDDSGGSDGKETGQTWSLRTTGARTVYGHSASNLATYGYLYNWYSVTNLKGICPSGWHVPSDAEWTSLIQTIDPTQYVNSGNIKTFKGFQSESAGVKLKSTSSLWQEPISMWQATYTNADNASGFSAHPGGSRDNYYGFSGIGGRSYFWSASEIDFKYAWNRYLGSNNSFVGRGVSGSYKSVGASVRCLMDKQPVYETKQPGKETKQPLVSANVETKAFSCGTSTVSDIDGNQYNTVLIGTQCWTKENLRVTKYRDGAVIPLDDSGGSDGKETGQTWSLRTTGARTVYGLSASNLATYGFLYNWYAASNLKEICPSGWHVPSDAEWTTLTTYLGGERIAGGKMKSNGTAYWNSPNFKATNESGFSGLPGGYRDYDGGFYGIRGSAFFWSSTEFYDVSLAWGRYLDASLGYFGRGNYINDPSIKSVGASVRCLRDKQPVYETQQTIFDAKQPVAKNDQPDDETIQPLVSRFNYKNKQISFNEKSDVISYMEGKSFDDGTGLTIEYGYISSLNTYGIIITNIHNTRFHYIDVDINTYGSFADLTGLSVNELSNGQGFSLRLYKDRLIVGSGELSEVIFYLKED